MTFGIDFDDTVVENKFPAVGEDLMFAVTTLKELVAKGHKIILWTLRDGKNLDLAIDWYKSKGIPLYGVNENPDVDFSTSPKCYCDFYIDDRALGTPLLGNKNYEGENNFVTKNPVDWYELRRILKGLKLI